MSRLEVTYNIREGDFPNLLTRIRKYLTPSPEASLTLPTKCDLPKIRERLPDVVSPFEWVTIPDIPWDYAAHIIRDLGILPIKSREEIQTLREERYAVPATPGSTRAYKVEFYGKNVNKIGDRPMIVRLDGELGDFSGTLYLLKSWYEVFKQKGGQEMRNQAIDVGVNAQKISPQYDAILAGLPKTPEEFERRIQEASDQLTAIMLSWSINSTRFYWDFFGRPIQESGHSPTSIAVKGPFDFYLSLSRYDLETIVSYPTLPPEEVVKRVFPKHLDDFRPVK